ncbi:uncharacterized protein PAC_19200 [Phialocephala subalpina]|uniref:Homeobox domain-containing protein n=1 Tax=Phialocephala subalpina TaxID=576137 RepID=A0A1L7XWC9_9HELO|nr:uncharacterized protein PAC_19200 [Phialocephala subalpina]
MAEPFITLSSSDSSDASPSESYDDNTPLSTPASTTHDTSRAEFHVKDLEAFARDLQNAADRAFPNSSLAKPRYANVSVLLLRWEDDGMNVEWELDDLETVFRNYGFDTERWLIPRRNAHLKLMSRAVEIVEGHDGKDDLVIIYYAGHAFINIARQATWCCKADPSYASLEWSAIQTLFEKAHFDVLLLLDCCAAASAAPRVGSAVTETIAACGFESIAPQPGRFSFTNSLIEVLEDWIDSPPFSAAMLHNRVLSVLKHERPERTQNGKRRKIECRRTPIHIVATADPTLPSIGLGKRTRMPPQSPPSPKSPGIEGTAAATEPLLVTTHSSTSKIGINGAHTQISSLVNTERVKKDHTQPQIPQSKLTTCELESIHAIDGDDYDTPRVIISLALERHQTLSSESCQKWLSSCPTLVKYAKVEAVYKSFSALLLLSIPVFLWNLLPENPACSFVGYVTSPNLSHLGDRHILSNTTFSVESRQHERARPRLDRFEVEVLEAIFQKFDGKPTTALKRALAQGFGVDLARMNNWFQNRRAKRKQEKKQSAYEAEVHSSFGEDDGYWSAGELTAMRLDEMPCEDTEDSAGPSEFSPNLPGFGARLSESRLGRGNDGASEVILVEFPPMPPSWFRTVGRTDNGDEFPQESRHMLATVPADPASQMMPVAQSLLVTPDSAVAQRDRWTNMSEITLEGCDTYNHTLERTNTSNHTVEGLEEQAVINTARLAEVAHDVALDDTLGKKGLLASTPTSTPACIPSILDGPKCVSVNPCASCFSHSDECVHTSNHQDSNAPLLNENILGPLDNTEMYEAVTKNQYLFRRADYLFQHPPQRPLRKVRVRCMKRNEGKQEHEDATLDTQERKKRKDFPSSWSQPTSESQMKKRVLAIFDEPQHLDKGRLMFDAEHDHDHDHDHDQIELMVEDANMYVRDLDVQTMNGVEALHGSPMKDERRRWMVDPGDMGSALEETERGFLDSVFGTR